jgi:7-cyano-7-deazaguanine synthase
MRSDVVLLSGGLDSTTLAAACHAKKTLHSCVSIRYGQPHMEPEMMAARKWCDAHKVHREVIDVPMPSSAAMRIGVGAPGPRVVAGRNLVLVAHAVQYAAAVGAKAVLLGACADDAADYADCRPEFIEAANGLAGVYGVRVMAPLIHNSKSQIVLAATALGVDVFATWSCYEPRVRGMAFDPCGTCNACRARAEGLRLAAVDGRWGVRT